MVTTTTTDPDLGKENSKLDLTPRMQFRRMNTHRRMDIRAVETSRTAHVLHLHHDFWRSWSDCRSRARISRSCHSFWNQIMLVSTALHHVVLLADIEPSLAWWGWIVIYVDTLLRMSRSRYIVFHLDFLTKHSSYSIMALSKTNSNIRQHNDNKAKISLSFGGLSFRNTMIEQIRSWYLSEVEWPHESTSWQECATYDPKPRTWRGYLIPTPPQIDTKTKKNKNLHLTSIFHKMFTLTRDLTLKKQGRICIDRFLLFRFSNGMQHSDDCLRSQPNDVITTQRLQSSTNIATRPLCVSDINFSLLLQRRNSRKWHTTGEPPPATILWIQRQIRKIK